MRKLLLVAVASAAVAGANSAMAADKKVKAPKPEPTAAQPAAYDWSGFYAGFNAGFASGSYDPTTSTVPDSYYRNAPDVAAINAAGAPGRKADNGFAGGVEAGYNRQIGRFVVGLEADLDFLHLRGIANSGAVRFPAGGSGFGFFIPPNFYPLNQFVVSSYADANWLFTLRPRIGIAADNWLFYATGGLAVTKLNGDFLFTDGAAGIGAGALQSARVSSTEVGYAVGGGIEAGITDRLSLKAEYLHVNFDRVLATQTGNNIPSLAGLGLSQTFAQSMDLRANILRVGLNYKLGMPAHLSRGDVAMPVKAPVPKAPFPNASDWDFDVGARIWFSSGMIGAPQPLLNAPPTVLASRLVYSGLDARSGESFARIDHSSGLFVKGFVGAGGITNGKMNDEDFPGAIAYSNTQQSPNSGNLNYANIDAGYTFLKSPGAKLGAFVGYNHTTQHVNTYNCNQIAGDYTCFGNNNFVAVAEDAIFDSLRLGLSAQFRLTDKLKFTADAAYLPSVKFTGLDDHNARQLQIAGASSHGDGVMLEAIADYNITNDWNVGIGGRYWAWNMRDGTASFNFLGFPNPPQFVEPARFNSERYGVFFQTSYHWGDTTLVAQTVRTPVKPAKADAPMNWSGIYVGGHVGGGWSDDRWSDPFGSTISIINGVGATNVAGFGDTVHATGPLGGGQVGANWQAGLWVFGVQADASAVNLRGENTCFSGIGGINCQRVVNSLDTVTARAGFAWGRSLVYAKGGGAWVNATYNLLGNTGALSLGTGSTSVNAAGWTAGAGFEYALSNHWTTLFEYNRIGIAGATVPFPTVAVINTQNIRVRQSFDLFKLGVNYRFDWPALVVARN